MDLGYVHYQSYSVIQQENMPGSTSHFQLALLESSSDSMLIRLFSPVDFVVSIRKGQNNNNNNNITKDPPHPLSKMDNPAKDDWYTTSPISHPKAGFITYWKFINLHKKAPNLISHKHRRSADSLSPTPSAVRSFLRLEVFMRI